MRMLLLSCLCLLPVWTVNADDWDPAKKTRVIATSDNEIDDRNSMVRFLLYSNEFNIRGIVYSASRFHSNGHNWDGSTQFQTFVGYYRTVYANLVKHSSTYPNPDSLAARVKIGNLDYNDITSASEGANLIRDVLLEADTSTIWVQCWGGSNTAAAALKQIADKYPTRKAEVIKKMRLYLLDIQDDTWDSYIKPNWPGLMVVHNAGSFSIVGYGYGGTPAPHNTFYSSTFMSGIVNNHGALAAGRSLGSGTDYLSEGDNPSWYLEIPVGLRSLENPAWGSWGGRYERPNGTGTYWKDVGDDGDGNKAIWRWTTHFQRDFLARADWCVKEYAAANHQPVVKLAHSDNLWAKAGAAVNLSAEGTTDPDNNTLTYNWWIYKDPGSYKGAATIAAPTAKTTTLTMPSGITNGQTIHVICEVTDNGTPPLTRYRRVVVTCGTAPVGTVTPAHTGGSHGAQAIRTAGDLVKFAVPEAGSARFALLRPDGRIETLTTATVAAGAGSVRLGALRSVKPGLHVLRVRGCGVDRAASFVVR